MKDIKLALSKNQNVFKPEDNDWGLFLCPCSYYSSKYIHIFPSEHPNNTFQATCWHHPEKNIHSYSCNHSYTKVVARQGDREIALETPSVEKCIILIESKEILYTLLVIYISSNMVTMFPIHYVKALLNSKILLEVMSSFIEELLQLHSNCQDSLSRDVGHWRKLLLLVHL